ncbi:MAG TPA: hypothetical protein VF273_03555 [Pelobium sp.]
MKINSLYFIALGLGLTIVTACNNEQKTEEHEHTDTVVVEKNTTQDSRTPAPSAATEPSTNVTVDKNGTTVNSNGTDVTVSKDSISFKKR